MKLDNDYQNDLDLNQEEDEFINEFDLDLENIDEYESENGQDEDLEYLKKFLQKEEFIETDLDD